MSADNGYEVGKVLDAPGNYGVYYYSGDGTYSFTHSNADQVLGSAIHAILRAHRLQHVNSTEYGVFVDTPVLLDAEREWEKR